MTNRWHTYYKTATKATAEKLASKIRRHSAHRHTKGFKVRVTAFGKRGQRFPSRGYTVEWYGARIYKRLSDRSDFRK